MNKLWYALALVAVVLLTCWIVMRASNPHVHSAAFVGGSGSRIPIVTYQKVYGPVGRIYNLNVFSDGTFEIINIGDGAATFVRGGRLTPAQFRVACRVGAHPPAACPLTPTGADSVTSRILTYSNDPLGGVRTHWHNLGVLTYDKMSPQASYDISALDMVLGDWRLDVINP